MLDLGIVAGMQSAWQAADDAIYTPIEAADDIVAYGKAQVEDLKSYAETELPGVIKTEAAIGLGTMALAVGGAVAVGGGVLYLLSEGKATNNLIRSLDPSRALKRLKVGF